MTEKLINLAEVESIIGMKKDFIYRLIRAGDFPKPIKLGRCSRWKLSEVCMWMDSKQ
ncbi:hypothetical protein B0181_02200 [Moraxella caviae]|uniref:Predicted transcriptional regulator n=1 Tax=Moraxella caviae TaxID=34060 RepID=A0A1T0A8W1_9GAMM|nr:AlpA family phage regulatory protein [Moraxella caviae]OOR92110.1 hypothetical protein B0181_02200 [Moraxella caviae]STZ14469.1 Predicted transcriptional regulator [Moraxella caviae]